MRLGIGLLSLLPALIVVFTIHCRFPSQAIAAESWERIDKKLKQQVYQINVGLKLKLKNGLWAQIADYSPKFHYPVFVTTENDKGFRVVGFGSSFPIKTCQNDKAYFVTNRHVVDSGDQVIKECERFYAAMRLYAEQTATAGDAEQRLREVLAIVNLSTQTSMGLANQATYQTTVDAIWDTYDTYLCMKADPQRLLFNKYLELVSITPEIGYFLHASGPVTQRAMPARLYKVASSESDPDLAILTVSDKAIQPLEAEAQPPSEGQEVQVIGYPIASEQIDMDAAKYYSPTFNTGRISRVAPRVLQVDAPITTGNSGGPVISQRGKVLGVVAVRALSAHGGELPNFGGAITIQSMQAFVPELFKASYQAPQ